MYHSTVTPAPPPPAQSPIDCRGPTSGFSLLSIISQVFVEQMLAHSSAVSYSTRLMSPTTMAGWLVQLLSQPQLTAAGLIKDVARDFVVSVGIINENTSPFLDRFVKRSLGNGA
jgi:hypothetical protein